MNKIEMLKAIAWKCFMVRDLETRSNGSDFLEVSKWQIKDALERAYEAGRNAAK